MSAPRILSPTTTSGGTPVGGSGTPGTIPVWSSGTTLGDSQLIQSATAIYTTTRNFGVGTTAGTFRLDVLGTGTSLARFSSVEYSQTQFVGGTQTCYIQNWSGFSILATSDSSRLQLGTNGTGAITIDSTQKVGIGTASPAVKLDIASSATTQLRIQMSGQADLRAISDTGVGIMGTYSAHALAIRTNSTNAIFIDSSQNVGIGTPSPTAKLEIAGGTSSIGLYMTSANGTATVFRMLQTGQRDWGLRIPASDTSLTFYDYSAGAERMRIDSTGNVILNTANAGATIQAAGSQQGLKLPTTNQPTYNTDPNTLDCYAEKDLTATMTCGTSGTITLSASTLKFTRVGRVVHVSGRLVINSVSSPLGRLQVDIGLGANERPSVYTSSTVWLNAWAAGFTQTPFGFIAPGGTILYVDRWGAGSMNIDAAQYAQANAEMMISLTYTV